MLTLINQRKIHPVPVILLVMFYLLSPTLRAQATSDSLEKFDHDSSEPSIYPSMIWMTSQLVPSPQLVEIEDHSMRFGMRWQITPLLYSWGLHKRLKPWRYFVSEPMTRQNGSIELYFSPEYLNLTESFASSWLFRGGIRTYLPLYRYGEYLSASIGTSYYNFNGQQGVSYEGGLYIFFGILGLQATYSPQLTNSHWTITLRLRYF
jgi:hypothetical protein